MNIDPSMGGFIDQMLQRYDYEPQAYRSCSLVLGKYRNFSYKLLNDVAQECLEHGKISVFAFDKVMESNAYKKDAKQIIVDCLMI